MVNNLVVAEQKKPRLWRGAPSRGGEISGTSGGAFINLSRVVLRNNHSVILAFGWRTILMLNNTFNESGGFIRAIGFGDIMEAVDESVD